MKLCSLILVFALPGLAGAQPSLPTGPATASAAAAGALKARKPSELASKGMLGAIGDTVPLKATLTSKTDGQAVPGRKVSFKVAGKDAGSATTGANGEARLDYKVPNDPPPGAHPMEARFAGDDDFAPSSVSANFGVFKASTKLVFSSPPTHVNEGETASLSGKLTRITDDTGIHGREIAMTVNGKNAGKVTTSYGGFTFTYAVPKPFAAQAGVHAQFEGDVLYAATAGTTAFTVKNPVKPGFLTWTGAKGKLGQTVTLTAKLTQVPALGPGIGGVKVRFWMDRGARWSLPHIPQINLCEGTTNSNGDASCSAKLNSPVLPYTAYAHADVDTDVWNITKISDPIIDIDKANVHVAVSGPASAHIGQTISIKARLTRTTDNAPIQDANLILSALLKTNANGEATFSIAVPSGGTGARSFKVSYAGNDNYEKGEGSVSINVQPAVN